MAASSGSLVVFCTA